MAVGLRRLCTITTALIYLQIVFGAVLRHTGERLDAHLLFAALVAVHVVLLTVADCHAPMAIALNCCARLIFWACFCCSKSLLGAAVLLW